MNTYSKTVTLTLTTMIVGVALGGAIQPRSAAAQSTPTITNLVPESESVTIHAKITAIDPATRAITLRGAAGHEVKLVAGPAVRLELLKSGDTVNARYYRSVAFIVKPPSGGNGTPVSDDQVTTVVAQPAIVPGGIGVKVIKVTGTVVGIDLAAHSLDVVSAGGGAVYTVDVTDPTRMTALSKLKMGDSITVVVSQALAVSIEPAPKSWF